MSAESEDAERGNERQAERTLGRLGNSEEFKNQKADTKDDRTKSQKELKVIYEIKNRGVALEDVEA